MKELWLEFANADGGKRRVEADKPRFIVGRHSEADLCIPDGRLSREHVRIERLGDAFFVSDLGSSNGSTLNGDALDGRAELKNGDELVLGDSVRIKVEIPSEDGAEESPETPDGAEENRPDQPAEAPGAGRPAYAASTASAAAQGSSVPTSVFFIAPVLGLLVVAIIGGLIYFMGRKQPVVASGNDFQYSKPDYDDDRPVNKRDTKSDDDSKRPSSSPEPGIGTSDTKTANPGNPADQPLPANLSENAKIEQNSAAFLRRVAENDPTAFLSSDQTKLLAPKVKQFSNSSALAANIDSARKNAARIRSLAAAKNLKPQFLAVAALAKLGNSRGDVLQIVNEMIDVLGKLRITINNELSDDSLLMIAVYDRSASGDINRTVSMLQKLATESNTASARAVRSIWFLQKSGKISPSEFDAALTFLAVGTITQNPKDFGVNAETLSL